MTVFTPEENVKPVEAFVSAIRGIGYQHDASVDNEPSDYAHSFVREEGKTRKVLKFRTTGDKISVFHTEFLLSTGSRRLQTWNIPSEQKMAKVIHALATEEALVY